MGTLNSLGRLRSWLGALILFGAMAPIAIKGNSPETKWVKVAVIDTGIDTEHPYLQDVLWRNPGETGLDEQGRDKATNGIDDDNNGFVDDVFGWNFLNDSNDLTDFTGHGTHVTGVIKNAIETNITDPGTRIQVISLKYSAPDANGFQKLRAFVRSIRYAIDAGVDVINISGGGYAPHHEELRILKEAEKRGIWVVAAAGNKAPDRKSQRFYPAAYPLKNILSVTAVDALGKPLLSSNTNPGKLNFSAPGYQVLSSLPAATFGPRTGTSQAAAYVSGVLAARIQTVQPTQVEALNEMVSQSLQSYTSVNLSVPEIQ